MNNVLVYELAMNQATANKIVSGTLLATTTTTIIVRGTTTTTTTTSLLPLLL
jgi:hypothetical protein